MGRFREQMLIMIEQNIQQRDLQAQRNEFENHALLADLERIPPNAIHLADDREITIRAYSHPTTEEQNLGIIRPDSIKIDK